jgi:bacteriorhodopsin
MKRLRNLIIIDIIVIICFFSDYLKSSPFKYGGFKFYLITPLFCIIIIHIISYWFFGNGKKNEEKGKDGKQID